MRKHKSITKAQIIRRLMSDCDLSYVAANKVHDCFISLVEESVVNLNKLSLGHVGSITPRIVKGKSVSMNFKRSKTGVEKVQRYFFLDERVRFNLRLFKSFADKVDYQYTKP
jgi:hypothetical protein